MLTIYIDTIMNIAWPAACLSPLVRYIQYTIEKRRERREEKRREEKRREESSDTRTDLRGSHNICSSCIWALPGPAKTLISVMLTF